MVLYRILKKKDAADAGLIEPTRERIVKILRQEKVRNNTSAKARAIAEAISSEGFASVNRKHDLEWEPTRYFRRNGTTGLSKPSLGQAVGSQVFGGAIKAGEATTFGGSSVGQEEADLTYIVYLEDELAVPLETPQTSFNQARDRQNEGLRRTRRRKYIDMLVKDAAFQDVSKPEDPTSLPGVPATP